MDVSQASFYNYYFSDAIDEGKFTLATFSVKEKSLQATVQKSGYLNVPVLNEIIIYGECGAVSKVTVNDVETSFSFNKTSCVSSI